MTQDFIRERQYLKAVSPKTIIWYGCSFKAFDGALESKEAVRQRIVELRQRAFSGDALCPVCFSKRSFGKTIIDSSRWALR